VTGASGGVGGGREGSGCSSGAFVFAVEFVHAPLAGAFGTDEHSQKTLDHHVH